MMSEPLDADLDMLAGPSHHQDVLGGPTVDFDLAEEKPLTGRRAAKEKAKKKVKAGSFGKLVSL